MGNKYIFKLIIHVLFFSLLISCTSTQQIATNEMLFVQGNIDNDSCPWYAYQNQLLQELKQLNCNSFFVQLNGTKHLIETTITMAGTSLIIYEIPGDLSQITKEIKITSLSNLEILNIYEFADAEILFIGIDNSSKIQNLYRYNVNTEQLQPLLFLEKGFVDSLILSPDKNKLTYLLGYNEANDRNQFECPQTHCYKYQYHILDLQTEQSININSLLEENELGFLKSNHCEGIWSDNSQFLSFKIGCYNDPQAALVVLDVINKTVNTPILFATPNPNNFIKFYIWTLENKLLSSSMNQGQPEHLLFDPTTNLKEAVKTLPFPYEGMVNQPYDIHNGTIYANSLFTTTTGSTPITKLIIATAIQQNTVEYTNTRITQLHWSPSGNFLSAIFRITSETGERSDYLTILDTNGNTIHQEKLSHFLSINLRWVDN